MYYVDGKRVARDKAIEISNNADNEMLTNALGANIELKDAQAILIIETKDPLEVGKYREFGWCFTNVADAVEAAKKVAALFGDRFTGARIMGDAEHFDNRIIATVDKAGNVEIKKQTPAYIFTAYQIVTGVDCNGRTERTETFATYCKEIGDDDFTGLYRAVTFYEDWHYDGWDIKTADGKIIAKGNTKAELQEAFENIKTGNVEVSEEIAEINAADVKVNVAGDGKVIEQIKVDVDSAIKIINRLNYRNDSFIYRFTTRDDNADIEYRHFDAYRDNGEKDGFAITEIVINGKLEIVRFANLFRDIIVHLQIGNVNYTIGDKGAIVLSDDNMPPDNDPLGDIAPDEYAISEAAMEVAINAEGRNADVASGNYSITINDEYVVFENHSIVRIDASRKLNLTYDHTGKNKIFRYGNHKASAAKVIAWYMNRERADEQGKYFHKFFDQYNKTRGEIEVWVELTYADDREHHFMAQFDQGRLADKFIADVKELAGDTPCQIFTKYRDNRNKPVWEDPHKYETVGNLEQVRPINYGEETVGDIDPEEYIITQEAFESAIKAEEFEAFAAAWTAEILSDPGIDAAYRKARERVEVEFTSYGAPLYTYIKKNGERCYEDFVAKCYIGKCGLSETDFIVKAKHDVPSDDITDAENLTTELKKVTRKSRLMEIYPQVGGRIVDPLYKVEVRIDSDGFIFTNGHEIFARYDTKEQCQDVIERIKRAIDGCDTEFEFPTVELVDLERKLPALMIEQFNKYKYRSKGRSIPRRFLAAQLKYYGLSIAELKEAHHAV